MLNLGKKSYEYFLLFNKEVFYNKLSYIWSLVFPIFFMTAYNFGDRNSITYLDFSELIYFYWGYMVLITAAEGIGIGILDMRDYNFLKMYTYLTGNKLPIILGKMESQCFFLIVNVCLFTTISGVVYGQPILSLLVTGIVMCIMVGLPIYTLFLISTTIKLKSNGVGPIITLFVLLLVNLALVEMNTNTLLDYIVYINPALVIAHLSGDIHKVFQGAELDLFFLPFVMLILYSMIDFFAYKKLDITTRVGR